MRMLAALILTISVTLQATPYYREIITTPAEFEAMSAPDVGIVKTGRAMKFFIDNRGGRPKVYFIDGNFKEAGATPDYVHYHYDFAMKTLGLTMDLDTFNRAAYFTRDEKKFIAGIIHTYGKRVVFQLYPQDLGHDAQLATAASAISEVLRLPGIELGFLRTGIQQKGFAGIEVPELLREVSYRAIETGEAVGYLRRNPQVSYPTDILILDKATDDVRPVAGVIVEGEAHVLQPLALRLAERGRPLVEMRDTEALTPWIGRLVRFKAGVGGYTVVTATDAEVKAAAAVTPRSLAFPESREVVAYDEMCPGHAADCLAKRATLGIRGAHGGFLRAALRANTTNGVAFSAAWYRDLIGSGIKTPEAILGRTVPASTLAEWRAAVRETLGDGEVELKLSAHPDDLDDWRYVSVRAIPDPNERGTELCRPTAHAQPLGCAVKILFAQLWESGPVADRVARGVRLESVAAAWVAEATKPSGYSLSFLTRLPRIDDVYGYFWAAPLGEEGIATFARDWEPEGFSLLSRGPRSFVTPANGRPALLLAKSVERAYCQADPTYYPKSDCRQQLVNPEKPKALWIEMNVGKDGGLQVTGMRELPRRLNTPKN